MGDMMTLQRPNLAGITTSELLEKIKKGEPFFVQTSSANVTRQMLSVLKKRHQFEVTTTQAPGGLWITPSS
jgi:hypothetical protein